MLSAPFRILSSEQLTHIYRLLKLVPPHFDLYAGCVVSDLNHRIEFNNIPPKLILQVLSNNI